MGDPAHNKRHTVWVTTNITSASMHGQPCTYNTRVYAWVTLHTQHMTIYGWHRTHNTWLYVWVTLHTQHMTLCMGDPAHTTHDYVWVTLLIKHMTLSMGDKAHTTCGFMYGWLCADREWTFDMAPYANNSNKIFILQIRSVRSSITCFLIFRQMKTLKMQNGHSYAKIAFRYESQILVTLCSNNTCIHQVWVRFVTVLIITKERFRLVRLVGWSHPPK